MRGRTVCRMDTARQSGCPNARPDKVVFWQAVRSGREDCGNSRVAMLLALRNGLFITGISSRIAKEKVSPARTNQ